ncbi:MAG: hypothetical protein OEZ02_00705 [Anaerolineae bacterium]|nr:hypothetical protein [Anaerolineae bacterium]
MQKKTPNIGQVISLALLSLPYLLYISFLIRSGKQPVDYGTFMDIGQHMLDGVDIYEANSYYPMPFVFVFAFFSWLPRWLSITLWFLWPVVAALAISGWSPYTLLFAPLFGHFVGAQSSVFGMLGLWGYRRNRQMDSAAGGVWLALTLIKPQLGLVPLVWAGIQWGKSLWETRRIPRQLWAFLAAMGVFYLPGFALVPDWPTKWLSVPRPLFQRALSGMLPRSLYLLMTPQTALYWVLLIVLALGLLYLLWRLNDRRLPFDQAVLWSFIASPLYHDYDLVQVIALLDTPRLRKAAALLSIPGWLVILTAYNNDARWIVFTLIAPGLLYMFLWRDRHALPSEAEARAAI